MSEDILISLHRRFADDILAGTKTVELRRRALHISKGARVWIYVTHPHAEVRGYAIVHDVIKGPPKYIWNAFGCETGISKSEFDCYFSGIEQAFALVLSRSKEALTPLSLSTIRKRCRGFHPPQFFKRLKPDSPELLLFSSLPLVEK